MYAIVGESYCCRHLVIFAQVALLHLNNFTGRRKNITKSAYFMAKPLKKKTKIQCNRFTHCFPGFGIQSLLCVE